jgi:DNA-binding CsgD family transcriptional regulator
MTHARRDRAARLREEIVRAAHAATDVQTLRRRVLPVLRKLIRVDAVWWALADPDTLLFSEPLSDEIPAGAAALFLENELSHHDINKFHLLARSPEPVATLYAATQHMPDRSPRFRDILRPNRMGDEMRVALRDRTQTWGFMCLHREAGAPSFSRDERTWMRTLAPHLAAALRHALLVTGASKSRPSASAPGVLLLGNDGERISETPTADELLSAVPEWTEKGTRALAIQSAVSRLRAIERPAGDELPPPRVRVATPTGRWLTISASRLPGPNGGSIAVVVEPARAEDLVPLRLAASGLTSTEVNVAALVMQGLSNKEVAHVLDIAPLTVQQHLKSIFDKTNTHSRGELFRHVSSP